MADWMEQQISDADESDDDAEKVQAKGDEEFASQIRTMVATDSVERLSVSLLRERLPEVDDVEALEAGLENDGREDAQDEYRSRLDALGALEDEEEEAEEPEVDDSESEAEEPEEVEEEPEEAESDDSDESEEEAEDSPSPFDSEPEQDDSSGEEPDTATETTEEPETPDTPTPDPEPDAGDAVGDGGTAAESESDSSVVDVKSIAPNVMTASDAADRDPRYTMLVWADPGQGKTHFACTGPEPVVIIDTEGKADEVARKFKGEGEVPESPFIFQPTNYDEALEALNSALDILDEYRNKAGITGTLVVDSMSVMWGWSQQKYVEKFYPGKDKDEVEFSSAIGGGQSDWKQIKRYHNVKFRQTMLDSPYHLIWTAMREDDYEEVMKGNRDADKPAGEKENAYKVDEVLRIQEGQDGAPIGVLNKSGKIKHRYSGLRYPTFDKHKELVDQILDAESGNRSVSAIAGAKGVKIHEGNPKFQQDDE